MIWIYKRQNIELDSTLYGHFHFLRFFSIGSGPTLFHWLIRQLQLIGRLATMILLRYQELLILYFHSQISLFFMQQ